MLWGLTSSLSIAIDLWGCVFEGEGGEVLMSRVARGLEGEDIFFGLVGGGWVRG